MHAVAAVEPKASGHRVEYTRPEFIEWYENKPEGVEQGFTLHRKPRTPTQNPSWVQIISQPIQGLTLHLSSNQQSIAFLDANQVKVLDYGQLLVKDARGKILASELRIEKNAIILAFDDQAAEYPVIIDPLLTTPVWTAESNQANAYLGFSVASAGDVNGDGYSDVIIAAPFYDNGEANEGQAYVYLGSAGGLGASAAWTAESNQAGAWFGYSVASAGDVNGDGYSDVIIGAYSYSNGETQEGRAYVYLGSASGLGASAAWTAESNQTNACLGYSVASAGDVNGDGYSDVIIGAPTYTNGELQEGRAYVYLGSASGLGSSPAWTAESNQTSANFGYSVASAGDVNGDGYSDVIIGAHYYDNGETNEGRAYVYLGSASGLGSSPAWTERATRPVPISGIPWPVPGM